MHKSQLALTLAVLMRCATAFAEAELPASLDLETVRAIAVQHDGRWPPLDTAARDVVESVTGHQFYRGHDPVLLLLAWTFDQETWEQQPLISISNAELRGELELPADQTVFSYAELLGHARLRQLSSELSRRPSGSKLNPLESKVSDIQGKLVTLQHVFRGRTIKPIPDAESLGGAWRPIVTGSPHAAGSSEPVNAAWKALGEAFLADDAPAFAAASDQLVEALAALPAAHRPAPKLIATELRYNRLSPFRTAWMAMVAGVVVALLTLLLRAPRIASVVALIGMAAGFALLTYGLWLRWHIAGRIPAANMFESLLFLSWGAGAFAIVSLIVLRDRFVPLTASVMGAAALILADRLPIDHFVRPIVPVLQDTIWMSIHVPIIMISYAVLSVAVLIAHAQLFLMALLPSRRDMAERIDWLHYWYAFVGSFLLLAGIITGSMWGASSWGRYWGWDPKEVWSLVAFLGYMAILHVRANRERTPAWAYGVAAALGIAVAVVVVPHLSPLTGLKLNALAAAGFAALIFVLVSGPFATALKSTLAFWLIIMTYVGVNYVLGTGLHSYGFGTGAVVRWMFIVGGVDLALIALCSIVYLSRRAAQTPATVPVPGSAGG
ncbi:MAG: cytochrome c biogenesis protein CcsA [Planctomycetes bacterium]|nr:cytochrome c biogenesis protein CcsA [Planctomycetota bacterium]